MKQETCPECEKGLLENKNILYSIYGQKIGNFEGEVCDKCGAEFFNEEQDELIEKKVKELGLFGLETETKIRQSGSSLSITIPKKVRDFLNIKKGSDVMIIPEDAHTLRIKV